MNTGLGAETCQLYNFQQALKLNPGPSDKNDELFVSSGDVYLCLGITYDSMGQAEDAKTNLLKAVVYYKKETDVTNAVKILSAENLIKKTSKDGSLPRQ